MVANFFSGVGGFCFDVAILTLFSVDTETAGLGAGGASLVCEGIC